MKQKKNIALYDVTPELMVDGKPISEWAKDQGWIQIGSWQVDPKTISLKWINETIAWEETEAKRQICEMLEDKIYEWKKTGELSNGQYKIILNYIAQICPPQPENKLPGEGFSNNKRKYSIWIQI